MFIPFVFSIPLSNPTGWTAKKGHNFLYKAKEGSHMLIFVTEWMKPGFWSISYQRKSGQQNLCRKKTTNIFTSKFIDNGNSVCEQMIGKLLISV